MKNSYWNFIVNWENNKEIIKSSFKEKALARIKDENVVNNMFEKSKKIVDDLYNLKSNYKNGLLIGKVQSGKTMNFLSVISSAFLKDFKIFIVFTSLDDTLENQTFERIKDMFDYNKNSSIMSLFKARDLKEKNDGQVSSKIINQLEMGNLIIITCLKNERQINNILNIFNRKNSILKKEKIFIIDDEGDLASISHSICDGDLEKLSKANIKISELKNINENNIYLSVTATPQAQMLIRESIPLSPERIFTIEPGNGYCGIEYFANENNNKIEVLEDFDDKTHFYQFHLKHVIYYYILSSIEFFDSKECINDNGKINIRTNMLIHVDAKQNIHREIHDYINNIISIIKQSFYNKIDFKSENVINILDDFNFVSNKYNIAKEILMQDKEYIVKSISRCIDILNVFIVNEKTKENKDDLNKNILSIVIGSKMLERGITLENLIVSFFINRSKGKTAIDTMLQRCRWFGYRDDIKKYMKVFTTKQIKDDFITISKVENDNWKVFKIAENQCASFSEISPIIYIDSDKLQPTNKVPYDYTSINKTYFDSFLYGANHNNDKCLNLIKELAKINNIEKISVHNFLTKDITIGDFLNYKDFLQNETLIDENSFNILIKKIKENNANIKIVYMNYLNNGSHEMRERSFVKQGEKGNYKILQLFQGKNENYDYKLNNFNDFYVGDSNFCNIDKFTNTVFIQIYNIRCIDNENRNIEIGERVFIAIINPFKNTDKVYSRKTLNKDRINNSI